MSMGRFASRRGRTTRWGRSGGRGRHGAGRHDVEAQLTSRLRSLPGPTPDPGFRAELRTQLVAITGRVVSESTATPAATTAAPRAGRTSRARALRRPALALASAATVLVLLLGMAVWMSSGSLPGDSLYGVKRASENVQLSMAGNDVDKGRAYLQLAGNRVREAAELLSQPSALAAGSRVLAAGQISAHTTSLVTDTLSSADEDTRHGMQLLGQAAVAQVSKAPLLKMLDWWPGQNDRVTEIRDRVPPGALRTRAQASWTLLQRIATRTGQLSTAMGCACLSRAPADELGPVPCSPCTLAPSPGGGGTKLPVPVPGVGSTPAGPLPTVSLPRLGGGSSSSRPPHAAGVPSILSSLQPTAQPSVLPAALSSAVPPAVGDPTGAGLPGGVPTITLPLPGIPVPSPSLPGAVPPLPID